MRRVAYVTDLHLEEAFPKQHGVDAKQNWQRILHDIRDENITEIVVGGDIGEASAHAWFFHTLKGFSFHLTLGNHDKYSDVHQHLSPDTAGTGELYYSQEDETYKYLFLDSSSECINEQQSQWLLAALRTTKKIILFIHHPVLAVATRVDQLHPLQNRTKLKECLVQSKREITIFCGHYHLSHERQEGDICQVISPAVSFQMLKSINNVIVDSRSFGYRILSFEENGCIQTTEKMFENGLPQAGVTQL